MSDDFSETVKRVLASRVGNQCSRPGCRALTSGPKEDPAKAVNVGVAAHITAASPGGPRYDPGLLPEERSGPENGIWLCQNDAKLIDNDAARFTVDVLKKWKRDAEAEASSRVGKTAATSHAPIHQLEKYAKVRISPIIPRECEQSDFMLVEDKGEYYVFQKLNSQIYVDIPKSFIENIHKFGNSRPALVQLSGRLQWLSKKRFFEVFPDKPPAGSAGAIGIGKNVDISYPATHGINGRFAREDRLPRVLAQGWHIFYDDDGTYLRWPGHGVDQILVSERP
jgi:hypothetical protein